MADLSVTGETKTIRVLHVDDDSLLRDISKTILQDIDDSFEIDQASCVDEGLRKLEAGNYDVVVSDFEMPQKDGLQFLLKLRKQNNEIPFILFTGKGREEVAIKALNQGANGYHNKQGSPETVYGELAHSIRQCVEHYKAKQNLIKSETKYSYLFSNMLNGFAHCKMIFDKGNKPIDWVYLEVNDAFIKLTGLTKESVIGKKVTDALPGIEKTNPELFEIYGRVALTGKEEQFDIFFDPIKIWLSVNVYSPEKGYFIAFFENISERKNAEEKLRGTFEVLERVGESLDAGLAVIGKDYRVVWANKPLMNLGVKPNKKCFQTFNHLETTCPDCGVKKIFEQNATVDVHEFKTINSKGETTWIELRVTPLKDKNGNVSAALELAVPITERKKAEQELQTKESKYHDIFNNSEVGMFRTRLDGSEVFDFNDKFLNILGLTHEEIKGRPSVSFWADPLERQEMVRLLKANGQVKNFECNLLNKRSEIIQCLTSVKLYPEQDILEGSIIDITELKKAEFALALSEKTFRAYLESSPISVFVADNEGKYEYVNDSACKMLGYSREELLTMSVDKVVPKDDHQFDRPRFNKLKENGHFAEELRLRKKDNSIIDVSLHSSKLPDGKLVAFCEDISERKKTEEALRQSEERFHQFLLFSPDTLHTLDLASRKVEFLNRNEFLGYSRAEIENATSILPWVYPDDRAVVLEYYQRALKGTSDFERPVEYRLKSKAGEWEWIKSRATCLKRDEYGKPAQMLVTLTVVTDRKAAEEALKKSHARIEIVNEKLHVVGTLTRHDVNNKLMVAKSNLYLLKKRIGDCPELTKYFDSINSAFGATDKIFEFSHLYERIGAERLSEENVFECFTQAIALVPNLDKVEVVNDCQGLVVVADSLLLQLFYNFIDNSLTHGESVTQIWLHYAEDNDGVKLFYEDNGVGILEFNKSRLFDAGFTTGNGSGLGLYLIKKMMDVYGWTIIEQGKPGNGARFVISIPSQNVKESEFT